MHLEISLAEKPYQTGAAVIILINIFSSYFANNAHFPHKIETSETKQY
jgi:hypothetical protein